MRHDGDYDAYNNYGDDDFESNWQSDQQDDFEAYEDYVNETGNDYYHLYDDVERNRLFYIRAKLRVWKREIYWRWKKLIDKNYRRQLDDLPF